jgi:hypothetical protein
MAVSIDRPRLYPRTVPYEQTPEQAETDRRESIRKAVEDRLYDMFASRPPESALDPKELAKPDPKASIFDREEDQRPPHFHGRMTKRPEFSQDSTGCELTRLYVLYLDTGIEDVEDVEDRRKRKLRASLRALRGVRPDLADLIEEHTGRYRPPVRLERIIERRPKSNRTVYEAHDEALDLIAGLVKPEQD